MIGEVDFFISYLARTAGQTIAILVLRNDIVLDLLGSSLQILELN